MSEKITYDVDIYTANIRDAGTDARVQIQLIGEKGKSPEIELNNPGDDFEQGQWGHYRLSIDDIGDLKRVRLFHNNGGMQPGWCMGALAIRWTHEESAGIGVEIKVQHWWPEVGSVTGTVNVKVDGSLFGLPTETTVNGVWLARDSGGIDKTFDLKTSGVKSRIFTGMGPGM
ncbi:PLAT/LH2 domain-containing protein [Streptomyces olivoreticuli]|uniref:PLAT/LH2 domain-containing protein n=1 Tax=Streptomyces olivoreticuli TaxID=68246 RepID=UPI002657EEAE|nr:PLAT/LH2 domain-containing protein [Streptomyces olivoreticuli]WKK24015.1 PLAT/LH2 domain-containing protein [Streptomyces olivoreticuli]